MNALELSPKDFRRLAADVIDLCAGYLCTLDERSTFPQTTGAESERLFDLDLPEHGMGDQAFVALTDVIGNSRAQNGRFFGYVQGSGEPIAALGDLLGSVLNQNITAWRSSPAGVTIERTVVRWLSEAVGCGGFAGTLTSGGSAANLMGLAMAREIKTPANERGLYGAAVGVIYASEQVHMAVPKAVAMLGIGRENLRYVPCDDGYRMVPAQLERAILRDAADEVTEVTAWCRRNWSGRFFGMRRKAGSRLQWWHRRERSTPDRLIRCGKLRTSRAAMIYGCTWMALMARWRRLPRPKSSMDWGWRIRFF